MGLPFQLIFSIILIAIFLYSAIVGINYFMERSQQAQIGQFAVNLESKVNIAWQAIEKSESYSFSLPKKIEKVCFANLNAAAYNTSICPEFEYYRDVAKSRGANMFFCPPEPVYKTGAPVYYSIDCEGNDCLKVKNHPYCIENKNGIVSFSLKKEIGDPYVYLE